MNVFVDVCGEVCGILMSNFANRSSHRCKVRWNMDELSQFNTSRLLRVLWGKEAVENDTKKSLKTQRRRMVFVMGK